MNKTIVAGVLLITATGIIKVWTTGGSFSHVLIGGYVLLLVLAVLDFFGGPFASLANTLVMLAVVTIVLYEFPWKPLLHAIGVKGY